MGITLQHIMDLYKVMEERKEIYKDLQANEAQIETLSKAYGISIDMETGEITFRKQETSAKEKSKPIEVPMDSAHVQSVIKQAIEANLGRVWSTSDIFGMSEISEVPVGRKKYALEFLAKKGLICRVKNGFYCAAKPSAKKSYKSRAKGLTKDAIEDAVLTVLRSDPEREFRFAEMVKMSPILQRISYATATKFIRRLEAMGHISFLGKSKTDRSYKLAR